MEEDMEAPEEVTIVEGKEEAYTLRKNERENKRRVAAEAKKRRKQQAIIKEEFQMQLKETADSAGLSEEHQKETHSLEELRSKQSSDPASAEGQLSLRNARKDGMLPDSIVNFLASREKQSQLKLIETDDMHAASTLKPKKKKMKTKQSSNVAGRVKVVVLKDVSSLDHVQNAKEFLQDRQSRVHRSLSMLKHFKGFPLLTRKERAH